MFNTIKALFCYLTHLRSLGRKSKNNFIRLLAQMRTRKFASEIYWPLHKDLSSLSSYFRYSGVPNYECNIIINFNPSLGKIRWAAHFYSILINLDMKPYMYASKVQILYCSTRNDMLQCFVCSPIPKESEKKEQPGRVSFRKKLLLTELVL